MFFSSCYCKVSIRLADCLPDTICQATVKFYPVAAAACIDLEGQQITDPAVGYTSIVSARLLSALSVYRSWQNGAPVKKSKNTRKKDKNDSFAGYCKSKPGDWVYFAIFPGDLPINWETWQLWSPHTTGPRLIVRKRNQSQNYCNTQTI